MELALRLGTKQIVLTNLSPSLHDKLSKFLDDCVVDRDECPTLSVDAMPDWTASNAIDAIISNLLQAEQEQSKAWIDATTLSAPDGTTIVIAGQSQTGKSTLSVAMFLCKHWRLVSEDVSFFDESNRIKPRVCAVSLRPDAVQLFNQQFGMELHLLDNEWFFDKNLFVANPVPASPGIFVILDEVANKSPKTKPRLAELNQSEALRRILPISNLIRLPDGVAQFQARFDDTRFYRLSAGSVADRVESIHGLLRTVPPQFAKDTPRGSGG